MALVDAVFPIPAGKNLRPVPFMPYLNTAPSAWVLPLKFDGGGYRAGGKAAFDSEGNLWVGDNFTIGWQASDALWQGHATKFAPNGRALSPITTGFTGGGMEGGTFGAAIDANDNAWLTNYGSKSITVFDKTGKPLTPPEGITFGGRLGLMQGVIVTPSGDVWVLGIEKSQLVTFPNGDLTKGRDRLRGRQSRSPASRFARLSISPSTSRTAFGCQQQRRRSRHALSRVRSEQGGKLQGRLQQQRPRRRQPRQRLGHRPVRQRAARHDAFGRHGRPAEARRRRRRRRTILTKIMSEQKGGRFGGSVNLLKPDGDALSGFAVHRRRSAGALGGGGGRKRQRLDFQLRRARSSPIVELCGVRIETCPPGMKTGDQISPPGGYVGGGLQMQTDIDIDPAGDVWAMNNWQDVDSCYANPPEALSTRCGGQGVVVFYGMAKPVRAPQIGPAQGF